MPSIEVVAAFWEPRTGHYSFCPNMTTPGLFGWSREIRETNSCRPLMSQIAATPRP